MVNMGLCWKSLYAENYSVVLVSAIEMHDLERDWGIRSSGRKYREVYIVTWVIPPQHSVMSWREGTAN